jgi:hypothetical protein
MIVKAMVTADDIKKGKNYCEDGSSLPPNKNIKRRVHCTTQDLHKGGTGWKTG